MLPTTPPVEGEGEQAEGKTVLLAAPLDDREAAVRSADGVPQPIKAEHLAGACVQESFLEEASKEQHIREIRHNCGHRRQASFEGVSGPEPTRRCTASWMC